MSLRAFEEKLGYVFQDKKLLEAALTHRSYTFEMGPKCTDNQRLEFLGDAVIDFVIADILFAQMPDAQEGVLSKTRSRLVCEGALSLVAQKLGFAEYIRMGRGETFGGGPLRPGTLADAYEAVIGAIYLDGGMTSVRSFIERHHREYLDDPNGSWLARDSKSQLQEITQRMKKVLKYQTINQTGPEHAPTFEIGVFIDGVMIASAKGKSKKGTEQAAAELALKQL